MALGGLQIGGPELPSGIGKEPGEVAQAFGVLEADHRTFVADGPVLAFLAKQIPWSAIHSDAEIEEWVEVEVIAHREVWAAVDTEDRALAVMVLDDGWIDQLYVDPAGRGMGLGSRLVELAKSRCREGLQLWTFASNINAQRFYIGVGWSRVRPRAHTLAQVIAG